MKNQNFLTYTDLCSGFKQVMDEKEDIESAITHYESIKIPYPSPEIDNYDGVKQKTFTHNEGCNKIIQHIIKQESGVMELSKTHKDIVFDKIFEKRKNGMVDVYRDVCVLVEDMKSNYSL